MDLDCMSDSSCEYEDNSDSVVADDISSILNIFGNRSFGFWQDVTFEMPITNQIIYPHTPTLIKVVSGNGSKYLLLQPPLVQSTSSENTDPNVPVVVDVTDKVVEVPSANPPVQNGNNNASPLVQPKAPVLPKKAPKKSTRSAKGMKSQFSILKEVKTPAVLSKNLNSSSDSTYSLATCNRLVQDLFNKTLQPSGNQISSDQEVAQSSQEPADPALSSLSFLPPIQENIEIACDAQPVESTDHSLPVLDNTGVDYNLLFQAWDDNSQQSGSNPITSTVHKSVEAVYGQTFQESNHQSTTFQKKSVIENNQESKDIATLVFFDLETTGLAHTIGTSNVQVTEVSMIAVDRRDFCKSQSPELKDVRIIHKLSMVVKPRSFIDPVAAKITGLDNVMLKDQEIFDENTAKAIVSFLSHLTKPACLLAHNGKCFDFPLLRAELKRLGMDFPSDLYLADTLLGLRAVDVAKLPLTPKTPKSIKRTKTGNLSMSLENLHIYFFNRKHQGGHSSEGDCIALAKVCHKMKDKILPWIDVNCVSGDTIMPMW